MGRVMGSMGVSAPGTRSGSQVPDTGYQGSRLPGVQDTRGPGYQGSRIPGSRYQIQVPGARSQIPGPGARSQIPVRYPGPGRQGTGFIDRITGIVWPWDKERRFSPGNMTVRQTKSSPERGHLALLIGSRPVYSLNLTGQV